MAIDINRCQNGQPVDHATFRHMGLGTGSAVCDNVKMPSGRLPRSAPALFSHVMADNAPVYRAILDMFAAVKRQFRLHLRPDEVLAEAAWPGGPPTLDVVQQALRSEERRV